MKLVAFVLSSVLVHVTLVSAGDESVRSLRTNFRSIGAHTQSITSEQLGTALISRTDPENEDPSLDVCDSGFHLEQHTDPDHGDVCRKDDGSKKWYPPPGCRRTRKKRAPYSVISGTDDPCRVEALAQEGGLWWYVAIGEMIDTYQKVISADPRDGVMADFEMAAAAFMPGNKPDVRKKALEMVLVLVSFMWLIFFWCRFYKVDRIANLKYLDDQIVEPFKDPSSIKLDMQEPDLVLVFHKPDHGHDDHRELVTQSCLEQLFPHTVRRGEDFARSQALINKCAETKTGHLLKKFSRQATALFGQADQDGANDTPEVKQTELYDVRVALIQDIYDELPKRGFDVSCFSSVDGEELFVCIGLHNQTAVKWIAQGRGLKLQVQQGLVANLGVDQPPEEWESSPPYLLYNPELSGCILDGKGGDGEFWEVFGKHIGFGSGSILSGQQRVRCIFEFLNRFVNLDYAVQQGMIAQWWPAHNRNRIAQLRQYWASWNLVFDFSSVQPATLLFDYFGARVTFIFCWTGLYCKLLLALIPMVFSFAMMNTYITIFVGRTEYWNRGTILGLSVIVAIWAKVAINLWDREEEFLCMLWDLKDQSKLTTVRADFFGELKESKFDRQVKELQYSTWKYYSRQAVAWIITGFYCFFVFSCVLAWLDLFHGRLNIYASVIQALMMTVFSLIYHALAEKLTIAENHKYQDRFYNSYLKKMFLFEFVNQYSAFLYIAVKMKYTERGCHNDDCLGMIQLQLPKTLLCLAAVRIVMVLFSAFQVKFKLWWESRQIVNQGGKPPVYSYVEEQSKYSGFRIREQIEVMIQLVLTLGYVVIFGAIAPYIVPLCLMVFIVQLRASAILVTTAANRAVPRRALGIGPWKEIVKLLVYVGASLAGFLFVQYGPLFEDTEVITKLTGFFLFGVFILLIWCLVNLVFPTTSGSTHILEDRREHSCKVIRQKEEDAIFDRMMHEGDTEAGALRKASEFHSQHATYSEFIQEGRWDQIPKAVPSSEENDFLDEEDGKKSTPRKGMDGAAAARGGVSGAAAGAVAVGYNALGLK